MASLAEPFASIRASIPAAQRCIYFANAATSPLPEPVQAAVSDFMALRGREGEASWDTCIEYAEAGRKVIANHLGTKPSAIAFMKSTGEGINHVARTLSFPEGSNVVTTSLEFPTNLLPWRKLARERGIELRILEPDDDGMGVTPERFAEAIDDKTHLVTLSSVTFQTGYRHDSEAIAKIAKEHDAYVLLDAIQGMGAVAPPRLDHVDFVASGSHKWLMAPFGIGFLYVCPGLDGKLEPDHLGWWSLDDIDTYGPENLTLAPDARRFEIGNLAFGLIAGITKAFEMQPDVDVMEQRIVSLSGRLMERLEPYGSLATPADPRRRAGIVSFRHEAAPQIHAALDAAGVRCSLRAGGIRFSPHYWNTEDEVDAVAEHVGRVLAQ